MDYKQITRFNIENQVRDNIKKLILDTISVKNVKVLEQEPFTGDRGFDTYPYIILPQFEESFDEYLKGNQQITFNVVGYIHHDYTKLGDDKLKVLKQELRQIGTFREYKRMLNNYGISWFDVTDIGSTLIRPRIVDNKPIVEVPFTLQVIVDVFMDA